MKKRIFIFLSLFILASCGSNNFTINEDKVIANALNVLREHSFKANTSYVTTILRKEIYETYQPLSIRLTENYNLSYSINENYAITISGDSKYEDMLYQNGGYEVTSSRTSYIDKETYYKDTTNGNAIKEVLNEDNTVSKVIMAEYDETDLTYIPINYDSEFKNPFEYLKPSDFSLNSDGTYSLLGSKAVFLAKSFQRSSLTYVKDAIVTLDSNNLISSIVCNIDNVDATGYTQESTYTCVISDIDNITINHVTPYSNSNPEIESLFNKVKNANNYTYYKEFYKDSEGNGYQDDITAFYTQDTVFFHHLYSEYKDKIYDGGNDYDYKVVWDDTDKIYYCYEYHKASDSTPYDWALCSLSGTTPLTYESFEDIGPTFYNLDSNLFYKNSDGSYSVVDEFKDTVGSYFDNQFIGVHSDVLDGQTSSFKMVLDGDTGFTVYLTYTASGSEQNLKFKIYDIDSTELPFEI